MCTRAQQPGLRCRISYPYTAHMSPESILKYNRFLQIPSFCSCWLTNKMLTTSLVSLFFYQTLNWKCLFLVLFFIIVYFLFGSIHNLVNNKGDTRNTYTNGAGGKRSRRGGVGLGEFIPIHIACFHSNCLDFIISDKHKKRSRKIATG